MSQQIKLNFLINIAFFTVMSVIVYFSVRFLLIYLFPFVIGLILTIAVQKPAAYISKFLKIKRGYCALFLVVVCYAAIISTLAFGVYYFGAYVSDVISRQNGIMDTLADHINNLISLIGQYTSKLPDFIKDKLPESADKIISELSAVISDYAKRAASAAPMFITSMVVTIIASCYIAKDYGRFKESVSSVLPEKYKIIISEVKILFNEKITKLCFGYFKLLCITFVELIIGLLLLGVKNAFLISAAISLLDLLPVFGTGSILIPWAIYSILNGKMFLGIGLAVLYVIIMIIRNALEPRIIGKQIGLHPLLALICVFIGLKIFGFIGMLILPLAVMLCYNLFERGIFDLLFSSKDKRVKE